MTFKLRSVVAILLSLCSAAHVAGQCTPITDAANALGLVGFVQALTTAGLDQQFSNATDNKDTVTIFVPNNDAFAALAAAAGSTVPTAATITPEQKALLQKVLQTHIVSGNYTLDKITNGLSLKSASGANLTFGVDAATGTANVSTPVLSGTGTSVANITQPNAKTKLCGYSLIHVINRVLTFAPPPSPPPGPPAAENCTNIVDAMNCSGEPDCLTGTLASFTIRGNPQAVALLSNPEQGYTIFAPSNTAAGPLIQDVMAGKYDLATLQSILLGHLAQGVYKSANMTDGQKIVTLANTTLTVKIAGTDVSIVGPSGDTLKVIKADFQGPNPESICGNSVAHVIDGVIALPKNDTTPAANAAMPAAVGSSILAVFLAAVATFFM